MDNQRYGMVFSTSQNSHYFYDSGTGKVVSCDENERAFIARILSNEIDLKQACEMNAEFGDYIQKEELFACPENRTFIYPSKEEFKNLIRSSCDQIILELTEACNLRCGYCIYNEHHPEFRGFGVKNLSFDIARKSIDYILEGYSEEKFSLTFYGGEPLVNFEVMRKCIEYTQETYSHLKLHIAFTTNLTLLTGEMVKFFANLENASIDIMCSLDGPANIHDKYRRYKNGQGSFENALRGFKLLLNDFYNRDKGKTLSINCVMAPPYSKEKLEAVSEFFYKELAVPKEITCNYSYMDKGDMVFDFEENEIITDNDSRQLVSSPLEEWAVDDLFENKNNYEYFDIVSSDMARISNRLKKETGVIEKTPLHGNCIPGQRRIYVTVDGEFKVCEKVSNAPFLGNYQKGYDFDKIYKMYMEDYADYFGQICDQCWARPMCSICYERTMDENGVISGIEKKVCEGSRRIIKDMFVNYYRFFEKDRTLLEELLSKYEFS